MRLLSTATLLLIGLGSKADTGCQIGSTLHRGSESFNWIGSQVSFSGTSTVKTSTCAANDNTSMYATNIVREQGWFLGYYDIVCRINNANSYPGYYVSYAMVRCPIDDYIPHMLLSVSAFGFLFIRRHFVFAEAVAI